MINYADIDLFDADVSKQLYIRFDNTTLTNSDIVSESFELTESLCSDEQLNIGACEAGCVKFRIGDGIVPLHLKTITVSIKPYGAENELQIGVFKVYSDKLTADRKFRDIVAYDAMYRIINADVMTWYNTLFPVNQTTTKTIKQIRDSFFTHFGITQESTTLINDSVTVSRTIDAEKLSGKDVICAICEANGCFGHIGRDGKFKYIYLNSLIEGLYPSEDLYPAEDLYPSDGGNVTVVGKNSSYISAEYEDYETAGITKLQIRQEEDDIGVVVGSGSNGYIIEGNFLFFGMSSTTLTPIAQNILAKLELISYRPSDIEAVGNPCLEVGDGIEIVTRYTTIDTYIVQRTLKGIQTLIDNYVSTGAETRSENVNSVNSQITALRGSTNKLTRTIERTESNLERYERDTDETISILSSSIVQTASEIRLEVIATEKVWDTGDKEIYSVFFNSDSSVHPSSMVNGKYYLNQSTGTLWIRNNSTYTSTQLTLKNSSASSQIVQNAQSITSKVSKGDVSSEISQEAGQVSISANRLVVSSTYFKLYSNGTGNLGGLSFDADGFYSIYNGTKILRVHPNPHTDGYALSLGSQSVSRLRHDPDFRIEANNYGFEIDEDGVVEVTTLNILDEWEGYTRTEQGHLHVDSLIDCYGNIVCGVHGDIPGGRAGSVWSYFTPGHTDSGCVNAENNISALGWNGGDGYVFSSDGTVHTSDIRAKQDISKLDESSEEFIYSLKPVRFRFKKNADKEVFHHGFIAQEVQEVNPDKEWNITPKIPHTEYYGLNYEEIIADLVKTVQSQNERIKALEEALNAKSVQSN